MTSPENNDEIILDMTSSENTDETIPDIKVERPRKIRAPHRYLPDGTYDNKPLSPTYVRDYWQKTEHQFNVSIVSCFLHTRMAFTSMAIEVRGVKN